MFNDNKEPKLPCYKTATYYKAFTKVVKDSAKKIQAANEKRNKRAVERG